MPSQLLFDISEIDLSDTVASLEDIQSLNLHRGESQLLERMIWHAPDWSRCIGCKRVRDDEWWCAGHVPGDPIFPGVLQVELGAQITSYSFQRRIPRPDTFVGFTRINNTIFRRRIVPGDEIIVLCQDVKFDPRRYTTQVQGLVNGEIAFETRITGMPLVPKGKGNGKINGKANGKTIGVPHAQPRTTAAVDAC